jgi:MFS family permease
LSVSGLRALNKYDFLIALVVAIFGLAVYTRVLAPDVLYSDSGEFQTLAYTWGTTHTTGYPTYLVLARIVGFFPIGSLAWRISFASALFAALTLGGVYLIVRHFAHQGGALLGSFVLLLSYTFWSQSVIAEVYTPSTAFITAIILALLQWYLRPLKQQWLIVLVGFLLGIGLGVHLFIVLVGPPVFLFVLSGALFGSDQERKRWSHLVRFILGGMVGLVAFYLLFVFIDTRPTPTNIFTTSIVPSRETWALKASDLDSEPERFWISVSGRQWQDRMIPNNVNYGKAFDSFLKENLAKEYATPTILLVIVGGIFLLIKTRRWFTFFAVGVLVTFGAGFLYFPGDKFIFYLPFYLLLAILGGIGAGALIALGEKILRLKPTSPISVVLALVLMVVLIGVCTAPFITSRWRSIERGLSGFVTEDYVYPVFRPHEARDAAECALSKISETDALLVLNWRALYAIYYIAHLEQGRTGIVIHEALPYPAKVMTQTLQTEISERLLKGEAVYVDDNYSPLSGSYKLTPVAGKCSSYRLFKLSSRG